MRLIKIFVPIWKKPRSVGVADYKITDDLVIEIPYKTKNGERLYPHRYYISQFKARLYPTQMVKGILLRIIPIQDLRLAP